jgi:hypothetical protein
MNAFFTLPSAVLTQPKASRAALAGPPPVTMASWSQPASVTALKQAKPSETTWVAPCP